MTTPADLHDEAAEWIGRLRRPALSAADTAAFAEWLARSDAHRDAFDGLARLWEQLQVLEQVPTGAIPPPARAPITAATLAHWWRPFALAGATIAIVAAVVIWRPAASTEVQTATGQTQTLHLRDGSNIEMNTATSLMYRLDSRKRDIMLYGGEAYFVVAQDMGRPFLVRTADGVVRATGTAFSILAHSNGGSRLALTQGSVTVTPAAASAATLRVSAPAVVLFDAKEAHQVRENAADSVAWRNGQLIYDEVTLDELLADMRRYMPANVTLADPALGKRRVSAVLRIQDQAATLDALARTLNLHWHWLAPDHIELGAASS